LKISGLGLIFKPRRPERLGSPPKNID